MIAVLEDTSVDELALQGGTEALGHGVAIADRNVAECAKSLGASTTTVSTLRSDTLLGAEEGLDKFERDKIG
jgi:hypothetical protein